jgi:hypothetical protein
MNRILADILAVMICAACAELCAGQEASTQPDQAAPAESISRLISQLSDPTFGVREEAEKALTAMGPGIEGQLRDAERGNLPDETRARLEEIIARFEEAVSLHATVTLHYKDAPVSKIVEDFAQQAGSRMGIDEPSMVKAAEKRVASVDVENADFWAALRAVCKATGLGATVGPVGIQLTMFPGRGGMAINVFNHYAIDTGGLLIVPEGVQELRRIDYTSGATYSNTSIPIMVFAEPKMHVIGTMDQNWMKECVDDKGHSLMSTDVRGRFFPGFMMQRGMQQWVWNLVGTITEPRDMGSEISRLRGELRFSAQTKGEMLEIDGIMGQQPASTRDGVGIITVLNCTKIGVNYRLSLRFEGVAMNSPEFLDFANSAQLVDDSGGSTMRQNYLPPRPIPHGFDVDIVFQPTDITPTKLKWERVLEEQKFMVPFEFEKLPLPAR